jgi:hypothetical protein
MSTAWLVICLLAGAGVASLWAYFRGRSKGYIDGYAAAQKAEHRDAEAKINAIRRKAEQEVQAIKERGQAASATIGYLYERAQDAVEQLDAPNPPSSRAERP